MWWTLPVFELYVVGHISVTLENEGRSVNALVKRKRRSQHYKPPRQDHEKRKNLGIWQPQDLEPTVGASFPQLIKKGSGSLPPFHEKKWNPKVQNPGRQGKTRESTLTDICHESQKVSEITATEFWICFTPMSIGNVVELERDAGKCFQAGFTKSNGSHHSWAHRAFWLPNGLGTASWTFDAPPTEIPGQG